MEWIGEKYRNARGFRLSTIGPSVFADDIAGAI
jgi:hypothetical protein